MRTIPGAVLDRDRTVTAPVNRVRASRHLRRAGNPSVSADILKTGAPGEIRTPDPLLRRQLLYPAELRARSPHYNALTGVFEADLSSSRRFAVRNLNGFGLRRSDFKF